MVQLPDIPLPIIHNEQLRSPITALLSSDASLGDRRQALAKIRQQLQDWGSLDFAPLDNGLFPAAALEADAQYTGYDRIWVRDNIHVAHAHVVLGQTEIAVKTVTTLMDYFQCHRDRFDAIISGQADAAEPMNRPHIRFKGQDLSEIDQKWAHAQNDALGYFLWLYCKLVLAGEITPDAAAMEMLTRFVRYFDVIRYWANADSGHWEEARKIEASSIGAVLAGLKQLRILTDQTANIFSSAEIDFALDRVQLIRLIERGQAALAKILPWECRRPDSQQPDSQSLDLTQRRYDAALLFLIYPLDVVQPDMAQQILADVAGNLQGDYGIKRYLGDSFWAPDYKAKAGEGDRTADVSDDSRWRDALLTPGGEAQWCIFDPIVSVIYAQRYWQTGAVEDLAKQLLYLGRALGQVTAAACSVEGGPVEDGPVGANKCPELYYSEGGKYVPNDSTPLLWTQANLAIALVMAEQSLTA